jgi:hypothetical protein
VEDPMTVKALKYKYLLLSKVMLRPPSSVLGSLYCFTAELY